MAHTLGKQLAQAREQQELAVEDVAHRTRIPANIVRYLENDDYSHFPNLVYARSFLKMYSRYLDVDASEFLDELSEAASARGAETSYLQGQMTREEIRELGRGWNFQWDWIPWRGILSFLFFIAVGTAAAWFIADLYFQNVNRDGGEGDGGSGKPATASAEGTSDTGGAEGRSPADPDDGKPDAPAEPESETPVELVPPAGEGSADSTAVTKAPDPPSAISIPPGTVPRAEAVDTAAPDGGNEAAEGTSEPEPTETTEANTDGGEGTSEPVAAARTESLPVVEGGASE